MEASKGPNEAASESPCSQQIISKINLEPFSVREAQKVVEEFIKDIAQV